MFELKTSPDIVQLIFLFSGGVIFNLAAFLLLPNPNSHLDRRVADGLAVMAGASGWVLNDESGVMDEELSLNHQNFSFS